jgi:hypothetical protein
MNSRANALNEALACFDMLSQHGEIKKPESPFRDSSGVFPAGKREAK